MDKINCEKHKKEVAGISNMKVLAEMLSDLHYETLNELLVNLSTKLNDDGEKDYKARRRKLCYALQDASVHIADAAERINDAWQISKPFMNKIPNVQVSDTTKAS